ncbi:MAG: N-acetylmuramidase family protein [Muribaculaceae bacterium]|nr:N-acetylmuramidase family protein [Muribaculaceae bacterium]MDE6558762.1 N-acetylmuramidase family protein [Muribaculaceae bacterium]
MSRLLAFIASGILMMAGVTLGNARDTKSGPESKNTPVKVDTAESRKKDPNRYSRLSDSDFEKVARQLNVEIAAIKAVVLIEAGAEMQGFWAPGVPVINFDRSMYNRYAASATDKKGAKGEKVPSGLKGYALSEWTQLINARKNNAQGANMGTFWGMFQIGGFNYKLCGCKSVDEFVRLMSYSEFEQLELFAAFLLNTGYVKDLQSRNWAAFARKYNGPNYARRGYHTKMANAYAKFKSESKGGKSKTTLPDGKVAGKELKVK